MAAHKKPVEMYTRDRQGEMHYGGQRVLPDRKKRIGYADEAGDPVADRALRIRVALADRRHQEAA